MAIAPDVQSYSSAPVSQTNKNKQTMMMSAEKLEEQKDIFLKMLMAQMTNQNPMEPMKTEQVTAQYSQFALVEQGLMTNKQLAENNEILKTSQIIEAANNAGRLVEAEGEYFHHNPNSSTPSTISYTIPGYVKNDLAKTIIYISDETGRTVKAYTDQPIAPGRHEFIWNRDSGAEDFPEGKYRFRIALVDANNIPIKEYKNHKQDLRIPTTIKGLVTGADRGPDGSPLIRMGSASFPTSSIVSMDEPIKITLPVPTEENPLEVPEVLKATQLKAQQAYNQVIEQQSTEQFSPADHAWGS